MRLNAANCVLLACLAAVLAAPEGPRSKRHLQQWKDAILSKFFGNSATKEEKVRFFRIPGHDNILVKVVPKIGTIETAVVAPERIEDASPAIAILKSYLGTKSASETLSALQGVKHLLQSGILSVSHEPSEVFPYEQSAFLAPPLVSERIEFIQPRPAAVIPGLPKLPLIPVLPPVTQAPQVIEKIIPIKILPTRIPELVSYPKFSYTQLKKDGSVVTYTVQDDITSDVVVTETNKPMPRPPSFIVGRLRKIFFRLPLGTEAEPLPPATPVFYNQKPFLAPLTSRYIYRQPSHFRSNHTVINIINKSGYDSQGPVVTMKPNDCNYRQMQHSFLSKYLSASWKEENPTVVITKSVQTMPVPPVHIVERLQNVAAKAYSVPKISRGYSFKINHEPYINSNKKEFSTSKSTTYKVEIGIPKPTVTKKNVDAVYFEKPVHSSYIYKQISHSNPQPFTVVKVEHNMTNKPASSVSINHKHVHPDGSTYKCKENHQVQAQFSKDYFYVPPVTAAVVPLPTTHKVEKLSSPEPQFSYVQVTNNGVHTYKDGVGSFNDSKQSNVLSSSVDVKVTGGKTSLKNSETFSNNPVVVQETTYSFKQTHSDGSAINVRGDNGKGVTVDLFDSGKSRLRGDIPEAF